MATTIQHRDGDERDGIAGVPGRSVLLAAAGIVAVGVVARRGELVRGGARLLAIQLAAAAIGGVVRRGAGRQAAGPATPPPMAIDAMAGWLAETLVGIAFDRIASTAAATPVKRAT